MRETKNSLLASVISAQLNTDKLAQDLACELDRLDHAFARSCFNSQEERLKAILSHAAHRRTYRHTCQHANSLQMLRLEIEANA